MFCQKHTKHTETITHSQTNHPLISRTSAVCINQNQEREHSTHLSVTFTKSVKTSAAMSKIGITGLFCIKPGVKVNRKSYYLTKCYLLSKTSQVTICFSTGQHTGVLNCVSKKVPTFRLSVTLTNLNRFQNFCAAGKHTKFATKPIWHYPPHLRHVATLPCKTKKSNFLQMWKKTQTDCIFNRL